MENKQRYLLAASSVRMVWTLAPSSKMAATASTAAAMNMCAVLSGFRFPKRKSSMMSTATTKFTSILFEKGARNNADFTGVCQ